MDVESSDDSAGGDASDGVSMSVTRGRGGRAAHKWHDGAAAAAAAAAPAAAAGPSAAVTAAVQNALAVDDVGDDGSELSGVLLVREASVAAVVPDVGAMVRALGAAARRFGGYVFGLQLSRTGSDAGDDARAPTRAVVTLRVPGPRFESALDVVLRNITTAAGPDGQRGAVTSEAVATQDVSGEYVDVVSKQHSDETAFARTRELMAAAVNLDEIFRIKRELDALSDSIARSKARRRSLEARVSMSTIRVSLSELPPPAPPAPPPPPPPRGWSALDAPARAFAEVLAAAAAVMDVLTYSAVKMLPLLLFCVAPLALLARWGGLGALSRLATACATDGGGGVPKPPPPPAPAASARPFTVGAAGGGRGSTGGGTAAAGATATAPPAAAVDGAAAPRGAGTGAAGAAGAARDDLHTA